MSNTDKTPITILNAVNSIMASTAPVLFLDTCAVLDVIRMPQRESIQNAVVSVTNEIVLKASREPKQLWIVAATLVINESNEKLEAVEEDLVQHVKKVDIDLEKLRITANTLFSTSEVKPLSFGQMNIPHTLRNIAENLLKTAIVIARENDCKLRAGDRVADGKRPSQKGKEEYKDCEIIEHYLEVSRQLRNRGFQEKCVFVSSNKKDFCEKNTTKIHPDLDTDFKEVGLEYAGDIAWANYLIFSQSKE